MQFSITYPRETQEMVFDAHDEAFKFFDGCCGKGIYDNMSTAVDAVLRGKERKFNKTFLQMCSHHMVEPIACSRAAGWEKGQVENLVKETREYSLKPRLEVADFDELNDRLKKDAVERARESSASGEPRPDGVGNVPAGTGLPDASAEAFRRVL